MKTRNILHLNHLAMCRLFMKNVAIMGLTLFFFSCGDTVINTEKFVSDSNDDFKLTLTVSDEIVRLNDSIKLTAFVERKVHKDSIDGYVSMKMIIDAVGGTIDGHSFSSASNISVSMDDLTGSQFQALAFFLPEYDYSATKYDSKGNEIKPEEYYNFMEKGQVSASFDNINVTIPVNMVEPR